MCFNNTRNSSKDNATFQHQGMSVIMSKWRRTSYQKAIRNHRTRSRSESQNHKRLCSAMVIDAIASARERGIHHFISEQCLTCCNCCVPRIARHQGPCLRAPQTTCCGLYNYLCSLCCMLICALCCITDGRCSRASR